MARARSFGPVLLASAMLSILPAAADATPLDRYIVVLDDGVSAKGLVARHARLWDVCVDHIYRHAIDGYSAVMTERAASAVASSPGVRWVERDRPVTATGQTLPTGVDRVDAEAVVPIDGVDERVDADIAVLDTGIDLSHPDLNARAGTNCISPGVPPVDANGHGSHVAGTAAALDNGIGVVGAAPGARVWAVKVLSDTGMGLSSATICGIDWAVGHGGIEVVNLSLAGAGRDYGDCGRGVDAQHFAICRAVGSGVTVAVAAGNEKRDAATRTPAAYDEVITVSSLSDLDGEPGGTGRARCAPETDDTFASYSNHGLDIDLIAPGSCIRSTSFAGGYATMSGTSMATPLVAGAAAVFSSCRPGAPPDEVRSALVAYGSADWNWLSLRDPDGVKEPLLDMSELCVR